MKTPTIAVMLAIVVIASACEPDREPAPRARAEAGNDDLGAGYAALAADPDADGDAWYAFAVKARESGDLTTADKALREAERRDYPPPRLGLERARLAVLRNDPAAATGELEALAEGGFTAVAAITGDPLLSSLAGRPGYDALIATLSAAAYPCEHREKFREFDFWIGEWEVRDGAGQLAGHNTIEAAHRGCVLIENWISATGGTGMSMNFLDAANDEWVQTWSDSGGGQIDIRGGMTEAGMQLSGQIHYTSTGVTAPFRGLWTRLPDGRVRQFFEQSGDDGETWQTWFEGFYSRTDEPVSLNQENSP